MKTLLETNAKSFPCLRPVLKVWPISEQKLVGGPWALAYSPIYFTGKHELLIRDNNTPYKLKELCETDTGLALADSSALKKNNCIDHEKATKVFQEQLGDKFNGRIRNLPVYQQGLAMAYWAHFNDDKDKAHRIFNELSTNWTPNTNLTFSIEAMDAIRHFKSFDHPDLQIHSSYVNVFFMSLLKLARTKGVLPSSLWIWLRPTDRTLFYSLNQVGGRSAWCEAAGPYAHFIVERKYEKTLLSPSVRSAIISLEDSLRKEKWLNEEKDQEEKRFTIAKAEKVIDILGEDAVKKEEEEKEKEDKDYSSYEDNDKNVSIEEREEEKKMVNKNDVFSLEEDFEEEIAEEDQNLSLPKKSLPLEEKSKTFGKQGTNRKKKSDITL
jgi:hypothetical protein